VTTVLAPAPAATGTFKNVAALGPHGGAAAEKLVSVHAQLLRLGAVGDAERLLAIDRAAKRHDFALLERMVSSEHSLTELSEALHERVRKVTGWRNVAALGPLIITWLLLGWASFAYHDELAAHPELSTQPFLVLWQQQFGGGSIPTFAETAFTACALLSIVLLLTVRAHQLEGRAGRQIAQVTAAIDDALDTLSLAVATSTVRPPNSAVEWAEVAQRVLTETQAMIQAAARDTARVAEQNRTLVQTAETTMETLREGSQEFIASLARESLVTLAGVREQNEQLIARTTEAAKLVLQQAGAANERLIVEQLTPLFLGFRSSLEDYRADQEVYRNTTTALAGGVTDLSASAGVLAESAQAYTEVAQSINQHLRLIERSQSDFVARVADNSSSMTTAATSMREITGLLRGDLRGELTTLTNNVTAASGQLAVVERELAGAAVALNATTHAMSQAAKDLSAVIAAGPGRRGFWATMLGR
jgi:hypothetical protein